MAITKLHREATGWNTIHVCIIPKYLGHESDYSHFIVVTFKEWLGEPMRCIGSTLVLKANQVFVSVSKGKAVESLIL